MKIIYVRYVILMNIPKEIIKYNVHIAIFTVVLNVRINTFNNQHQLTVWIVNKFMMIHSFKIILPRNTLKMK
jgi:hypothetical protein